MLPEITQFTRAEITQFIRENEEMLKELGKEFRKENMGGFEQFIDTHAKQPILTTEDGVEIFEGTQVIYTLDKRLNLDEYYAHDCDGGLLYFSSIEARLSYIIQNKPLTSVKEQVNAILQLKDANEPYSFTLDQVEKIEEVLTELAKSKL